MALEKIKITVKRVKEGDVIPRTLHGMVSVSAKAPEDGLFVKSSGVGSPGIYIPGSRLDEIGHMNLGDSLIFDSWEEKD
jgi:hypothetical protein